MSGCSSSGNQVTVRLSVGRDTCGSILWHTSDHGICPDGFTCSLRTGPGGLKDASDRALALSLSPSLAGTMTGSPLISYHPLLDPESFFKPCGCGTLRAQKLPKFSINGPWENQALQLPRLKFRRNSHLRLHIWESLVCLLHSGKAGMQAENPMQNAHLRGWGGRNGWLGCSRNIILRKRCWWWKTVLFRSCSKDLHQAHQASFDKCKFLGPKSGLCRVRLSGVAPSQLSFNWTPKWTGTQEGGLPPKPLEDACLTLWYAVIPGMGRYIFLSPFLSLVYDCSTGSSLFRPRLGLKWANWFLIPGKRHIKRVIWLLWHQMAFFFNVTNCFDKLNPSKSKPSGQYLDSKGRRHVGNWPRVQTPE